MCLRVCKKKKRCRIAREQGQKRNKERKSNDERMNEEGKSK
jgi:hypothetical protein